MNFDNCELQYLINNGLVLKLPTLDNVEAYLNTYYLEPTDVLFLTKYDYVQYNPDYALFRRQHLTNAQIDEAYDKTSKECLIDTMEKTGINVNPMTYKETDMWCVTFPACPPCSLAMQSQFEDMSTAYYYKTMSYRLTPAQRDVFTYYEMIKEHIRATQVGSTWTRQPTPTSFLFAHFAMEDARKNVLELFGIRYHEHSFSENVQTKFIGNDSVRLTYPPQTVRLCLLLTVGHDGHVRAMLEGPYENLVAIGRTRNQFFKSVKLKNTGHATCATQQYRFVRKFLNSRCVVQDPDVELDDVYKQLDVVQTKIVYPVLTDRPAPSSKYCVAAHFPSNEVIEKGWVTLCSAFLTCQTRLTMRKLRGMLTVLSCVESKVSLVVALHTTLLNMVNPEITDI